MRGTFGADLPAVGEDADLARDLACGGIVVGTRLDTGDDLDVASILSDERDSAIVAAIYRDLRRGRNGEGAKLAEARAVAVPAALTVVAPSFGAIPTLRG